MAPALKETDCQQHSLQKVIKQDLSDTSLVPQSTIPWIPLKFGKALQALEDIVNAGQRESDMFGVLCTTKAVVKNWVRAAQVSSLTVRLAVLVLKLKY
jgi:hypothetical protein